MARAKGIIAYGTDQDREKVAAMAEIEGMSVSEWIIDKIRSTYTASFGDTDPQRIKLHRN